VVYLCDFRTPEDVLGTIDDETIKWMGDLSYKELRLKTEKKELQDGLYLLVASGSRYFVFKNGELSWV